MSKALVLWDYEGGDILVDGHEIEQPLCLEPCQWNRVLQDPWHFR